MLAFNYFVALELLIKKSAIADTLTLIFLVFYYTAGSNKPVMIVGSTCKGNFVEIPVKVKV